MRISIIILFPTFCWRLPRRFAPRNDSESTPCDDGERAHSDDNKRAS